MFTFPDARALEERERRELTKLAYAGFIEIRHLLWSGQNEQATAAVEAFHNLPLFLYSEQFSYSVLRQALENYQSKFAANIRIDFVAELDRIAAGHSVQTVLSPKI